jgi:CRP-like cAMP-binding protein
MTDQEITEHIRRIVPINDEGIRMFFEHTKKQVVKKNRFLLNTGDPSEFLVLITSGCLMTYFSSKEGQSFVLQFGREMWWTGDLKAFYGDRKSFYSIKAIIDSEVRILTRQGLDELSKIEPQFERYFRIVFQNALISHQQRIIRNISYSAEAKYLEFLELYPRLELVVPSKYIASFLGITPEFLSKIKRKLALES